MSPTQKAFKQFALDLKKETSPSDDFIINVSRTVRFSRNVEKKHIKWHGIMPD